MANLGDFISLPSAAASQGFVAPAPVFAGGYAGGYGGGDGLGGGGVLTGLILGSLVGGGFGRDHGHAHAPVCPPAPQIIPVPFPDRDRDCATTDDLNALQASVNTGNILTGISDIKAAVPLAEAQVQLALAGAVSTLTANNNASTAILNNGQTSILLNAAQNANAIQRDICAVDTNVDRTGTMLLAAINNDGEKTRSLIVANQIAELNRIAAERQDEIIELRYNSRADRDRHGIEISMVNNQNQNQLQFQAQAQALNTLHHGILDAVQSIKATNQAINIGAGTQVANPTNTNSNVRA